MKRDKLGELHAADAAAAAAAAAAAQRGGGGGGGIGSNWGGSDMGGC